MYTELDDLLEQNTTIDAWYDDGFLIARSILNDFSQNDWNMLKNNILNKDLEWQKKLAYSISNKIIIDELDILMELLKINNDELTEICIDSLKLYCIPKFENIIKNNPNVLKIIHDKNNFQSNFTRTVIEQVMQILNFRS